MHSTEVVTREARDTDLEQLFENFVRRFADRLAEHVAGECVFLVAELGDQVVGHVTVRWRSAYPYFRDNGIPEIHDLNVVEKHRRRGIASRLVDEAEHRIRRVADFAGIGFGLPPGYRAAQSMYIRRGYVPDGQGVYWKDHYPPEMAHVVLDEDLVLYLTRRLR